MRVLVELRDTETGTVGKGIVQGTDSQAAPRFFGDCAQQLEHVTRSEKAIFSRASNDHMHEGVIDLNKPRTGA
jgi:hypothetical protein